LARYSGKKGVVYISTSGTGNATTIVGLNNWTYNRTADNQEVSQFGDTNKAYVQGLADATGDLSGFWDDTDDNLYDASISSDGCKMYLYPSSDATTKYFYGPAYVDFSVACPQTGPVTVSGSWVASGAWGQM
jgi:hypothetical protein